MQAAEGLTDALRKSPPANEQSGAVVNGAGTLTRTQSGWDPYEVWRTRVKRSSTVGEPRKPSAVSARSNDCKVAL
jgi:hypothetical protein